MRITYCIPSLYNSGGMERVLTRKANYLADIMDWEVTIITSNQNNRPPFYDISPRVRTIDLGIDYEAIMRQTLFKRIRSRLKAKKAHKKKLTATLLQLKPDICVSMFTHEMTFLPTIKDGSKKVLELHFSKSFRYLDAQSNNTPSLLRLINSFLDWNDRRHIRKYDRFVVLSNRDAADWGKKYSNMTVISNPSTFVATDTMKEDSRKVLAVGRLCAQKGFDMLIDAWGMLPEATRAGWSLDIVGSGPDRSKLQDKIEANRVGGSVSILPPTRDVKELYRNHSIFCFPSRYEGFGLSLMEAMSFGTASIAFDCPCGPSEMIIDGVNGILVKPGDISGFSGALQRMMSDARMRSSMGLRGAQSIKENFSEEVIMKKWLDLFEKLSPTGR